MVLRKSSGNLLEKLVPVLLVASIGLAFVVGILWNKVQSLEGGSKTSNTGSTGTTNTGTADAAQPAGESKLSDLPALVASLEIDTDKFQACVDDGKYADRVESDYQDGLQAGVQGTPGSFVVNKAGDTWFVPGAYPYENVKIAIDTALGKADAGALPQGIEKLGADQAAKVPKLESNDHVRGNRNAQVLLIEYSDFQCPFCQRFHATGLQVLDEYGNDAAWVYRHFPLDQLHPQARPAAVASECVYEIGGDEAFWQFADKVFGSS